MSNYSYGTPPPPPPPPAGMGAAAVTPWYKKPGPLFLLGLVIAAAVAIPLVIILLGGDDEGTAASTSTTAGATTTAAVTTTVAASTSTTAGATTTTAAATTTTAAATTTTAAATTTTVAATTTTATGGDTLDYNLPAVFQEDIDLAGGFMPDPVEVAMQAGGPLEVDLLVSGCNGHATAGPSVDVNYTEGGSPLLRFYFVADNPGEDATLIVSDPYGNWVCNDDYDYPGGIVDPAVDFTDPSGGVYDIWVASYSGMPVDGTLYITELAANHP